MIKQLMQLLFSTGLSSSTIPNDEEFFNEPSTLRPQLTAAAAKDSATTADDLAGSPSLSSSSSSTPYQIVARDFPGARLHYAAPAPDTALNLMFTVGDRLHGNRNAHYWNTRAASAASEPSSDLLIPPTRTGSSTTPPPDLIEIKERPSSQTDLWFRTIRQSISGIC